MVTITGLKIHRIFPYRTEIDFFIMTNGVVEGYGLLTRRNDVHGSIAPRTWGIHAWLGDRKNYDEDDLELRQVFGVLRTLLIAWGS